MINGFSVMYSKAVPASPTLLPQTMPISAEAVIMAGGRGERLRPLTDVVPKPLLPVGQHPIIFYILKRLIFFNIKKIHVCLNYESGKIYEYISNLDNIKADFEYIREKEPLGTIGAVRQISGCQSDYLLIINADVLTTINFAAFYQHIFSQQADMGIATTLYQTKIPYAVLQTHGDKVLSLKEKPINTYNINTGIYFLRKEYISLIPYNQFFNATDLAEIMIKRGNKVVSYTVPDYWLDIGTHEDYQKAQQDIAYLDL